MKSNKSRMAEKKKRDEEWAAYLRTKQHTPTKLRTGPSIPYSKQFSEVTITRPDGTVEVAPAKKRRKRKV